MKYDDVKKAFENPEAMERSAPFWSWNAKLEPDELRRQIREMADKGMGGFFMHSRIGLETEYLGDEWMEAVSACVDEAKKEGVLAWLYDEDKWPSGGAGGLVARGVKENGAKGITVVETDEKDIEGEILHTYAAVVNDGACLSYRLLENGETKNADETYMHVRLDYLPPTPWYNDTPPVDNMNGKTVSRFIETTYERYREEFEEEFGKTIPGIFTDEPNVASSISDYGDGMAHLAYTEEFPEFFKSNRGYEYSKIIPALFYECENSREARHDYFRTFSELFTKNFSKQIYEWCEKNNLAFTGHWLAEDRMGSHIALTGSILPNYYYQHIPGIDMLREQTSEFMTIKGCSSVANQTGRKRMLSETYGVSGWQFSFEGQKWVGDYQYVQGINIRCQHLAWYSMKGGGKRDYPPVFNYQTPWWEYNNVVEDYFARIGALTAKGEPVADTLMIHPVSTAWMDAKIAVSDNRLENMQKEIDELGFRLNGYTRDMMSNHIDFDYGDETIMAMEGRVSDGGLEVGKMTYSKVLIPPFVKSLFKSTVDLLVEFMDNGGKVVCEGSVPGYTEGRKGGSVKELTSHANFIRTSGISETAEMLERRISVELSNGSQAGDVFTLTRDMGDAYMYFLINNDRESAVKAHVTLSEKGSVEKWDPLTGNIGRTEYAYGEKGTYFTVEMGPAESAIYMQKKNDMSDPPGMKEQGEYRFLAGLGMSCEFERTHENVLVLDMCRFNYDGRGWSGEDEIWRHQMRLRKQLGMQENHVNREPQRYLWAHKPHENDGKKLRIAFDFTVEEVPEKTELVIEEASNFDIYINGEKVDEQPEGWFVDRCMGRLRMPKLKTGLNHIELELAYMSGTELENIYLIGDFGVSPERIVVSEPGRLRIGDWGLQGYFFYHAGIRYRFPFEYSGEMGKDLILDLGRYSDVVTVVRINGKEKIVPWKALSKVQIGDMLEKGGNIIEIEVMGAPRNMFGPLHLADTREKWRGSFIPKDGSTLGNMLHTPGD